MKYYAIKKGRTPGIYTTWDEARKQVMGFSGAIYKSFATKKEAQAYMEGEDSRALDKKEANESIDKAIAALKPGQAIAFCDGSFNKKTRQGGFGIVLIQPESVKEMSVSVPAERLSGTNNFGAEMLGAAKAIQWAIRSGIRELTIYYDYQGIECFATGSWQPKNALAQEYAAFVAQNRPNIRLHFVKVPAHTGVEWNEKVDTLAKKGAGLQA